MFKLIASGVLAPIFSLFLIVPAFANDTGIASMLHSLRSEKAMVCMVRHFHHGKSPRAYPSKARAMRAAVHHWVSFTAAEYGTDWGRYRRAASRTSSCEKVSRSSWTCRVEARPCRKGLSVARR